METEPTFVNLRSSLAACPICQENFSISQIQTHVNSCLDSGRPRVEPVRPSQPEIFSTTTTSTHSAGPPSGLSQKDALMALVLYAKEKKLAEEREKERLKQEEEHTKLLHQMLDNERQLAHIEKQKQVSDTNTCQSCKRELSLHKLKFLESCPHIFCEQCIRDIVLSNIETNTPHDIKCNSCAKPLLATDIKMVLTEQEYEQYDKLTLQAFLEGSKNLVKCPNEECQLIVERYTDEEKQKRDSKLSISQEAQAFEDSFRFRCRECSTEFCSVCKVTPFHKGFTCKSYQDYLSSKKCRFCASPIKSSKAKREVCEEEECQAKAKIACWKKLECGHDCAGLHINSKKSWCLPCLEDECATHPKDMQSADDYCNICWTEGLGDAPCIQLQCGHIFHKMCLSRTIAKRWTGARIAFNFLHCPLCKQLMKHSSLKEEIRPSKKLLKTVEEKALERLKIMQEDESAAITSPDSQFYKKPKQYALYKYSYFECFKCKKPYYGGERACENEMADFKPEELVCAGCSDVQGTDTCPKHGKEYIEYKCKFCCNVAVFFCWGNTHFCEPCHQKASEVARMKVSKLPKCNCKIKHPPNGTEFCLGCSYCRAEAASFG